MAAVLAGSCEGSMSHRSSISSDSSSLSDNNNSKSSPSSPSCKSQQLGPKHKLISEADVQVCRLNHTRTIVSKIMNSRYLRRWESHRVVLEHNEIKSNTVSTQFCQTFICVFLL